MTTVTCRREMIIRSGAARVYILLLGLIHLIDVNAVDLKCQHALDDYL